MSHDMTILVPVDFSTHSRAATERACQLGSVCDAEIRLFHALQHSSSTLDYPLPKSAWTELRSLGAAQLEETRKQVSDRGLSASTRLDENDPAEAIRAAARRSDVGLIVMGSHGRRGLDRFLLGSVSERLLDGAPVPVLVVPEDEVDAAKKMHSILFATDFSKDAERAEGIVVEWARRLGAEVEVIHVIREAIDLFAPYAVTVPVAFDAEMREAAEQRISEVLGRFRRAGVSAKSKIVVGYASEEILDRAESTGAQLIAMGSRGYSGLKRFRLGSVVQRVIRRSTCSVLVAGPAPPDWSH